LQLLKWPFNQGEMEMKVCDMWLPISVFSILYHYQYRSKMINKGNCQWPSLRDNIWLDFMLVFYSYYIFVLYCLWDSHIMVESHKIFIPNVCIEFAVTKNRMTDGATERVTVLRFVHLFNTQYILYVWKTDKKNRQTELPQYTQHLYSMHTTQYKLASVYTCE